MSRAGLRVLVSADTVRSPMGGIGRYALELMKGLRHRDDVEVLYCWRDGRVAAHDECLTVPQTGAAGGGAWRARLRELPLAYRLRGALRRRRFAAGTRGVQFDIHHEPSFLPAAFPDRTVVTVQDLSHVRHPETHPRGRVDYLNRTLPGVLQRAAHVITPSRYVRDELMSEYGIPSDRVTAVPLAVAGSFQPRDAAEIASVLASHGLFPGRYVLSVSTLEARKNIDTLLDAYMSLPEGLRREFPLVVVGAAGWRAEATLERLRSLAARGEVIMPGHVDEATLLALYAGATVFAFVSLYEGFGFPALEAMASGTAVVSSQGTTMEEFGGDALALVEARDKEAVREAIRSLLEDESLRVAHETRGLEIAADYRWDACVDRTVAVYRRVLHGDGV